MSKLGKIAEIPAGRRTKWLVVGFWVVVVAVLYPLSAKLTGAEKNNASAWLPASAESVKVLDVQQRFQSPNDYPGVVVYYRACGQPGRRVVLLRGGEFGGQRVKDRDHDHPKAHHQPLGPAPGRNLGDPAQLAHRSPQVRLAIPAVRHSVSSPRNVTADPAEPMTHLRTR